ncbi:MAG: hypothetical protein MHM6MM_007925 [Cercozoa sp. M6MM]
MADQQPQDLPRWLAALQPVLRNHGVGPAAIDVMSSAFARQARFHREDVAAETRRLRENTEQLEQHRRELEQQHRRELEQRETMFQEQLRAETERHREQVARLEAELVFLTCVLVPTLCMRASCCTFRLRPDSDKGAS